MDNSSSPFHLPGVCPEGYTSAGADCDDIDECVANNGHGPCQDICVNTDGSFKCACDVSFQKIVYLNVVKGGVSGDKFTQPLTTFFERERYRVTHQVVPNLLLTSKQKMCFSMRSCNVM